MVAIDQLTHGQFERHSLDVLLRELGADGLARFLRLHRSGTGNYTEERDAWQQGLSMEAVLDSIRENRGRSR